MDGWTNGWVDIWMDGWMGGWANTVENELHCFFSALNLTVDLLDNYSLHKIMERWIDK